MDDPPKVYTITVSAEEKNFTTGNRGTFVSWTVRCPGAGWTIPEAHQVTSEVNEQIASHAIYSQLAKGAITKQDATERLSKFSRNNQVVLNRILKDLKGSV